MPVICQLCNQSFEKQITNSHLKHAHGTTTTAYKEQFGAKSLSADEYRLERSAANSGESNPMWNKNHSVESLALMSDRRSGKPSWNKGVKLSPEECIPFQESAKRREARYKEMGYHPAAGQVISKETRQKISEALLGKSYATPESKEKAKNTKIANGTYGISYMKGKHHTDESKLKMVKGTEKYRENRKQKTIEKHILYLKENNIEVIDIIENGKLFTLKCLECEYIFRYTRQNFHLSKRKEILCPNCRCANGTSVAEQEIYNFTCSILPFEKIINGDRSTIYNAFRPLELDIWFPERNLAIEYGGLWYHSENFGTEHDYHIRKYNKCKSKNIRLITIFEDEWVHNKDNVLDYIYDTLVPKQHHVEIDTCIVKFIDQNVAKEFYDNNHILFFNKSEINIGLFENDLLIAILCLNDISTVDVFNRASYEIVGCCVKFKINEYGIFAKLFDYFVNLFDPEYIVSHVDLRLQTGAFYEDAGFIKTGTALPIGWYIGKNITRVSENEFNALGNNRPKRINRIFDCGRENYIWLKK